MCMFHTFLFEITLAAVAETGRRSLRFKGKGQPLNVQFTYKRGCTGYGQLSLFTFLRVCPLTKWQPKQTRPCCTLILTAIYKRLNEGLRMHLALHDTKAKHPLKPRHIFLQASQLPFKKMTNFVNDSFVVSLHLLTIIR